MLRTRTLFLVLAMSLCSGWLGAQHVHVRFDHDADKPAQAAARPADAAASAPLAGTTLTADEIMARVAANQDRSEKARSQYVYRQHIYIVTRKFNGKVVREETADYRVLPTPDGTKRELQSIKGRYWKKGKYIEFASTPVPEKDSLDGELVSDFRDDTCSGKSKDGISRDMFPLTTGHQQKYQFKLLGGETLRGRPVYRVGFRPKDNSLDWAGEAYIDKAEFQPVRVFTKLARRIPFAVRTLLGTDLPGIGFNVEYQRQPDGVWFPISLGTEFRLHVLFFINRDISLSLQNQDFERANVASTVKYEESAPPREARTEQETAPR